MTEDFYFQSLLNDRHDEEGEDQATQPDESGMLKWLSSSDVVQPLIEAIHSENRMIRMQAAKSLTQLGRSAVIPLILALRDDDAEVWKLSAAILVKIGSTAVESLLTALHEEEEAEPVQILLIEILGQIGDPRSIHALIELLRSNSSVLRTVSGVALARIGEVAVSGLLNILMDFQDRSLHTAVTEIVKHIGSAAVPPLLDVVQVGTELERNQAGWLLSQLGESAVLPLRKALLHKNDAVRYTATLALGNIGSPSAIPELIGRLSDTARSGMAGLRICDVAAKSLETIGTPEAQAALERWEQMQAKRA